MWSFSLSTSLNTSCYTQKTMHCALEGRAKCRTCPKGKRGAATFLLATMATQCSLWWPAALESVYMQAIGDFPKGKGRGRLLGWFACWLVGKNWHIHGNVQILWRSSLPLKASLHFLPVTEGRTTFRFSHASMCKWPESFQTAQARSNTVSWNQLPW